MPPLPGLHRRFDIIPANAHGLILNTVPNPTKDWSMVKAELRRLQTGAAIALGVIILGVIIVRAVHGNVFPPGWWRQW